MEKEKGLLKIAAILHGIFGCLFLAASPVYGMILLAIGIFIYSQTKETDSTLYKNKEIYLILAILGLGNLVSSILIFIAYDDICKYKRSMNAPPKVIYKVDNETKKIDLLLKLGVGMVFVSGILFSTTSWNSINNYIKAFALILFGTLFLILSLLSERRFKLYRSSYLYWMLSMSFFVLTIIGILYFGIFGTYLTYAGRGSNLAYTITIGTITALLYITYLKFPKKYILYIAHTGFVLSFVYLFTYIKLSQMMTISIISLFTIIINIFHQSDGTVRNFSKILSYILFAFILGCNKNDALELLAACTINILNLNYLAIINKEKEETLINIVITYILILIAYTRFTVLGNYYVALVGLTTGLYAILINSYIIPTKKATLKFSYVTYSILTLGLFIYSYFKMNYLGSLALSGLYFIINSMFKYGLFKMEKHNLAYYLEPIIIPLFTLSIFKTLLPSVSLYYVLPITMIICCIIHLVYKNNKIKNAYFAYISLLLFVTIIINIRSNEFFPVLLTTLSGLYLFAVSYIFENKNSTANIIVSYLLLLTSLYIPFVEYNILSSNIVVLVCLFIFLLLVMIPLLANETVKKISLFYILLPLITLTSKDMFSYEYNMVLLNIVDLYTTYLLVTLIIKDYNLKNIIGIIGLVIFLLNVFFIDSLVIGLYIGIVGILVLLLNFKNEKLYPTFIIGIIITIANIIYRLKEVWKLIPFWLYLLVGGLAIIGFVMYREILKQKAKETEKTTKSK